LVLVSGTYLEARETIIERLPASVNAQVRDRVIRMTEAISGTVAF
jgi:hypothetical protein